MIYFPSSKADVGVRTSRRVHALTLDSNQHAICNSRRWVIRQTASYAKSLDYEHMVPPGPFKYIDAAAGVSDIPEHGSCVTYFGQFKAMSLAICKVIFWTWKNRPEHLRTTAGWIGLLATS